MSQTPPNGPTPPEVPEPTVSQPPWPEWAKIPRMIALSQIAYKRDLPRLLQERPGQWVAYSGDECLGFGRRQIDLIKLCERRGLKDDEYVVLLVEPWDPDDLDPEEYLKEPWTRGY
jgi:hypothetical protein